MTRKMLYLIGSLFLAFALSGCSIVLYRDSAGRELKYCGFLRAYTAKAGDVSVSAGIDPQASGLLQTGIELGQALAKAEEERRKAEEGK